MKNNKQKKNPPQGGSPAVAVTIATHHRVDIDAMVGVRFLQLFGEKKFAGIRQAVVEFLKKVPEQPVPNTIYVDIGDERHGPFNEHRSWGRLEESCSTKLVAEFLGLGDKRYVKELVAEVLACDTEAKTTPSQLANLIKGMHRMKEGDDEAGTYLWATTAIDAIVLSEKFDRDYDLRNAWSNFQVDFKVPKNDKLDYFIHKAYSRRNDHMTELAHICACMDPAIRQKWLLETFQMLLINRQLFVEAVEEINSRGETFEVATEGDPQPVMMIESDREMINQASSSEDTGCNSITIIRNSTGLTQILVNPKLGVVGGPLDTTVLRAMIRLKEYRLRTGGRLWESDSMGDGTIPECPQWHCPNPNTLLNGSFTHPEIEASRLTLPMIREILENAFVSELARAWFNKYHEGAAVSDSSLALAV